MNSVGIAELNIVFNISFQCGEERNDPILEIDLVLIFRLVWKLQKTEPKVVKIIKCDNIKLEVLARIESFPRLFCNASIKFVIQEKYPRIA